MAAIKLFYFKDVKARGEAPKLLMKLGKKPFEDVRFTREEWVSKFKAISPSGQAPWIELDDGRKMCQSSAISLYCASEAGMLPSDPYEVARTIELTNCIEDALKPLVPSFRIQDMDNKLEARKALCEPDGAFTQKLQIIDALVAASTTEFYCGDNATLADIQLFCALGNLRSGVLDGISTEYIDSFEKMAALRSKVASIPEVKEMYAGDTGYEP